MDPARVKIVSKPVGRFVRVRGRFSCLLRPHAKSTQMQCLDHAAGQRRHSRVALDETGCRAGLWLQVLPRSECPAGACGRSIDGHLIHAG